MFVYSFGRKKTPVAFQKACDKFTYTEILAAAGEDGLANLGAFGSQINKISPAFDSRHYEYGKLGALVRETGLFEVQEVPSEHNPAVKVLYVKLKG